MPEKFPKFRTDLIITSQKFAGETFYVLKDPLSQKFFRIKDWEYFITQNLDGKTPAEEIINRFQEKFNLSLSPTSLNQFIEKIDQFSFLEKEEVEREQERIVYRAKKEKNTFKRVLFLKLKAFDPDAFITKLYRKTKFVFSKSFLIFMGLVILLASLIGISNWGDISWSIESLTSVTNLLGIWLTIFWVISLHEFAHALTCKYYGGEVREMGFLLLYFQPCFYSNLSDAWFFSKKAKIIVSFAGAFFQIFIWALATILWRITDTQSGLNHFFFVTMITSGVIVLFNFNPLIKLDGYYLLSDYLEIPNLRAKAFSYLGAWFKKKILGLPVEIPKVSNKEKKVYPVYGILSLIYSFFLIGFFFFKLAQFLVNKFQLLGLGLFLVGTFFIFKYPLSLGLASLREIFALKKESFMQPKKLLIKLGILAVIILGLVFVKWELKVSQDCEIAALEYYTISSQADAFMEEQLFSEGEEEKRKTNVLKLISAEYGVVNLEPLVKEGQQVDKGDLIAQVTSNQYKNEMATTVAMIDKAKADYAILKKGARPEELQQANDNVRKIEALLTNKQKEKERNDELWQKKLISQEEYDKKFSEFQALESDLAIAKNTLRLLQLGAKPEELSRAQAEIQQLEAKANFLKQQIQAQDLKSPISGTVTSVRSKGDLISIARLDTVRVLISASEKDMDVVKAGQKVKAKVRAYPGKSFYGVVTKVAQQAEKQGNRNIFIITSKVANNAAHLKPGMTGQAKIYCGKRSLLNLLTRKIVRWFRVEVWSWF